MNEEALKLTLSSSPHAHSPNSTRRIMLDVVHRPATRPHRRDRVLRLRAP